jgi:hypothetical protein
MSISKVIESIEHDTFSHVMNPPKNGFDGQADIKMGWVICPYCMKKQFKVHPDTRIKKMPYKCKNSKCQKNFIVNVLFEN